MDEKQKVMEVQVKYHYEPIDGGPLCNERDTRKFANKDKLIGMVYEIRHKKEVIYIGKQTLSHRLKNFISEKLDNQKKKKYQEKNCTFRYVLTKPERAGAVEIDLLYKYRKKHDDNLPPLNTRRY